MLWKDLCDSWLVQPVECTDTARRTLDFENVGPTDIVTSYFISLRVAVVMHSL